MYWHHNIDIKSNSNFRYWWDAHLWPLVFSWSCNYPNVHNPLSKNFKAFLNVLQCNYLWLLSIQTSSGRARFPIYVPFLLPPMWNSFRHPYIQSSSTLFNWHWQKFPVLVALQEGWRFDSQDQEQDTTGPGDAAHTREKTIGGQWQTKWPSNCKTKILLTKVLSTICIAFYINTHCTKMHWRNMYICKMVSMDYMYMFDYYNY